MDYPNIITSNAGNRVVTRVGEVCDTAPDILEYLANGITGEEIIDFGSSEAENERPGRKVPGFHVTQ